MSYSVALTDNFKREAKKLIKKYASLKKEITELLVELADNPTKGTLLGNNVYKIRLAIASKNKGRKRRCKGNDLCSGYRDHRTTLFHL